MKCGKQIALRGPEQKRFCRLDTPGDGYNEADLLANIVRKQEAFVFAETELLYSAAKQVKTVNID